MSEQFYRIERRVENQPTLYYWQYADSGEWFTLPENATYFTEEQRRGFLERELKGEANRFPSGGCWVKAEKVTTNTGYENGRFVPSRMMFARA